MKNNNKTLLIEEYDSHFLYQTKKNNLNISFNRIAFIFFIFVIISLILSTKAVFLGTLKNKISNLDSSVKKIQTFDNELKSLSQIDSSLQPIFDNFYMLTNNLNELISQISDYENTLDIDPSFLNDLQVRLSTLKFYQKKYDRNIEDLISYKNELINSLSSQDSSNNINQLSSLEQKKRIIRDKSNKDLSTIRKIIALQLEDKLIMTLKKLGIPNVRFKVVFEECEPTINGIDKVNFMFSANPGLPLAPLAETASGGEKSRVLLAIKAIFSAFDQANLLIFDEIDSGVSGSVSSYVATTN